MKFTLNIHKAINTAASLHLGQTRKGDGLPYIVHPFSVSLILSNYTDDENIIIAGLLHDVLEDVENYSMQDMTRDFGDDVTKIVLGVSEDKNPGNNNDEKKTWRTRKEKYLENLKKDSFESLMVSCADKIHNLTTLTDAYSERGEAVWDKFNAPKEDILWYYEEIIKIMNSNLDNPIVKELKDVHARFLKTVA